MYVLALACVFCTGAMGAVTRSEACSDNSVLLQLGEVSKASEKLKDSCPDGQSDTTSDLNSRLNAGSTGLLWRVYDYQTGEVKPASFWRNDIKSPNQAWNEDVVHDNWPRRATVGGIVASHIEHFLPSKPSYTQVFYGHDSGCCDPKDSDHGRCRYHEDGKWFECPGWKIENGQEVECDPPSDCKGPGSYPMDNFGGAGCHFDGHSKTINQISIDGSQNLFSHGCMCNDHYKTNNWDDWVQAWVDSKQKIDMKDDFVGDSAICWVTSLDDMVAMQNALWYQRQNWRGFKGGQDTWGWGTNSYWGWNENPVSGDIDQGTYYDTAAILLPVNVCCEDRDCSSCNPVVSGSGYDCKDGGCDTLACLDKSKHDDLYTALKNYYKYAQPADGYKITIAREYTPGNDGVDWQRFFFCENWEDGGIKIVHDTNANTCRLFLS